MPAQAQHLFDGGFQVRRMRGEVGNFVGQQKDGQRPRANILQRVKAAEEASYYRAAMLTDISSTSSSSRQLERMQIESKYDIASDGREAP